MPLDLFCTPMFSCTFSVVCLTLLLFAFQSDSIGVDDAQGVTVWQPSGSDDGIADVFSIAPSRLQLSFSATEDEAQHAGALRLHLPTLFRPLETGKRHRLTLGIEVTRPRGRSDA